MAAAKHFSTAAILERFYDAERIYMAAPPTERDASGMVACISPAMRLYQSPDLPYGGVYEGLEGFLQWSKQMSDLFDVVDVQNPRVLEGDGEAVVLSTLHLRVRRTGQVLVRPLAQQVKTDGEKGVITEIRPFYWDVAGLNAAVAEQ
ncbi:hypothetical protein GQ53DRAFT_327277 [Thozetella sp. PMI_491]|nr:hypothetical protein GQ53DRAFT_327277 [Thozetella sp. PMI_491]